MNKKINGTRQDKTFDVINVIIMTVLMIVILYPLYFVLIASVSDPYAVNIGNVWLVPQDFTLEGYQRIFRDMELWQSYGNSFLYMSVGTLINVLFTIPAGYALSKGDLKGRTAILMLMVFTLFFNGGIIPTYMTIRNLNLLDTFWVMVLPNAVNVTNLLICRTFFSINMPQELREAAEIDGCTDFKYFVHIVIPLSKAIIMVMVLYYAVAHWNTYFDALIYLQDADRFPLQIILRQILSASQVTSSDLVQDTESIAQQQRIVELIKYCVIVVSNLPLIILYPFIQRYFKKGVMIGAVKG